MVSPTLKQYKIWDLSASIVVAWYSFNLGFMELIRGSDYLLSGLSFIVFGIIFLVINSNKKFQKIRIKMTSLLNRISSLGIMWLACLYELYFTFSFIADGMFRQNDLWFIWDKFMSFGGLVIVVAVTLINRKLFLRLPVDR